MFGKWNVQNKRYYIVTSIRLWLRLHEDVQCFSWFILFVLVLFTHIVPQDITISVIEGLLYYCEYSVIYIVITIPYLPIFIGSHSQHRMDGQAYFQCSSLVIYSILPVSYTRSVMYFFRWGDHACTHYSIRVLLMKYIGLDIYITRTVRPYYQDHTPVRLASVRWFLGKK